MVISIYEIDEKYFQDKLRDLADRVLVAMQEEVPARSGALRKSLNVRYISPNRFGVGSSLDQAYYTEYGRGEVRPKRKKYLRYYTKSGDLIFSKYSRPAPPQHWLERTAARFK